MESRSVFLCLINENEMTEFLKEHSAFQTQVLAIHGGIKVTLKGDLPLEPLIENIEKRFSSFFLGEHPVEETLHLELIKKKKTVAFAESCTGGVLASKLTAMPGASHYFLGSIVAYSNAWKERFLQVSRSTIDRKGAVSREVAIEMVEGIFRETDADFAAAVSGIAGPEGGTKEKPIGTVYVAIGERNAKVDAGLIYIPQERKLVIEMTSALILGGLWRRIAHGALTFS